MESASLAKYPHQHFKFHNDCVCCFVIAGLGVELLILYPPYVCASTSWGSPVCHPIRTKSDLTKRLPHLGGLLWSRHWDALRLRDCLHSFSQQFAHYTSALTQRFSCLVVEGAAGPDGSIRLQVYRITEVGYSVHIKRYVGVWAFNHQKSPSIIHHQKNNLAFCQCSITC